MGVRDKTIDRLRGLAMVWVIVVHVLYWGSFFTNGYFNLIKSFCLFEMPLFFFVTGAGCSMSKKKGYFRFVGKRYVRIMIPYLVFAVICAAMSIAKYSMAGTMGFVAALKVLVSWLLPLGFQKTSIGYLTWALWFIPVYLCIVPIIPLMRKTQQSKLKFIGMLLLAAVFGAACWVEIAWMQTMAFYTLWIYIGLFYSDLKAIWTQKKQRKLLLLTAFAAMGVICALYLTGCTLNMQSNKFPPNMMFLAFSVMMMSLILWAIPYLERVFEFVEKRRISGKLFDLFKTHSMTVFLYQVFAFNLTVRLVNRLLQGKGFAISSVKAAICLLITIPVCGMFAAVFGRIERIGNKSHETKKIL